MYAILDTETTGFARNGVQPRIVSIAWMIADSPTKVRAFKSSIVRPDGFAISAQATAVHGISNRRAVEEGRPIASVLADFTQDIMTLRPAALVAHNADFDLPVLAAEFDRLGKGNPFRHLSVSCTMLKSRQRWPGHSATLSSVYERVFGRPMQNAHNAGGDVIGCAEVFFYLTHNVFDSRVMSSTPPKCASNGKDPEYWASRVDTVLEWAAVRPNFDCGFVESLRDWLALGRELTTAQMSALDNIIRKWSISV